MVAPVGDTKLDVQKIGALTGRIHTIRVKAAILVRSFGSPYKEFYQP